MPSTPSRKGAKSCLSEVSLNKSLDGSGRKEKLKLGMMISTNAPVRLFPDTIENIEKQNQQSLQVYLKNNIHSDGSLELFGFSKQQYIPAEVYDNLFKSELDIKKLTLRSRGNWDTCHCPKVASAPGEQIDTIKSENITNLEEISVMRTFNISACALLDLVSRSPKLTKLRFYGNLTNVDHHEAFDSVRFLSDLNAVYWPWCIKKRDFPTLRTLIKRNDRIKTFYSSGEITCDLLSSDSLPNLTNLSLILNEKWAGKAGGTKRASRYLKKIPYLATAQNLEALELRTFDLELNEEDCNEETNTAVRRLHENYQLTFWEQLAKLTKLKFLAVYGAWDLDKVSREIARHVQQIQYLRTNLMPSSLIPLVDARQESLVLSMVSSVKQLCKLANLSSLHFTCHENLTGIDRATIDALKELSDLIWVFNIRTTYTQEVDELLTQMLRRGNQQGKYYKIKVHIENSETTYANLYFETILKISSATNLKAKLDSMVEAEVRERFGRSSYRAYHIWGIEQADCLRDKTNFERVKNTWQRYEEVFDRYDAFM